MMAYYRVNKYFLDFVKQCLVNWHYGECAWHCEGQAREVDWVERYFSRW